MTRLSIKRVKFDGRPIRQLGYNRRYAIENKTATLNKNGRKMVTDLANWLMQDYEENHEEIGKIRAEYYLEPHELDLGVKQADGSISFDGSNVVGTNYEMILKIIVPLLYTAGTEVHTYRLNVKGGEFEHEDTEIL